MRSTHRATGGRHAQGVTPVIEQPQRFHLSVVPTSRSGLWALGLAIISLLALVVFYLFVAAGQTGGETFTDNLLLSGSILTVAAAGIGGLAAALFAIVRRRELALLLAIPILWGLLVLMFALGELLDPH
jgi:hypothetical protein